MDCRSLSHANVRKVAIKNRPTMGTMNHADRLCLFRQAILSDMRYSHRFRLLMVYGLVWHPGNTAPRGGLQVMNALLGAISDAGEIQVLKCNQKGISYSPSQVRHMHSSRSASGGQGTNSTTLPDRDVNTAKSSRISTIVPSVVGFPQPIGGLSWPRSKGGFARHHRPWSNTAARTPQCV